MDLVQDAHHAGARLEKACETVGISLRALQRWKNDGGGEDRRRGPRTAPANKLEDHEIDEILRVINLPEYRDLPPSQIVPRLADLGRYLASEATIYRILRSVGQLAHRSRSRPATVHRPGEHVATGPNQVFSWDITYLRAAARGTFYYLYLVQDVFSRKIVGWAVHDRESAELAAELVEEVMLRLDIAPDSVVLHSDNGGPMKGATMLATLQRLGVVPSFSRPGVSDDNPYIEALFRTLKYRPEYPSGRFGSLEEARRWMALFVHWYNTRHLHSSLNFVTPADRHSGKEVEILENRKEVYAAAKRRNPERWTGATRNWAPEGDVVLNPAAEKRPEGERTKAA